MKGFETLVFWSCWRREVVQILLKPFCHFRSTLTLLCWPEILCNNRNTTKHYRKPSKVSCVMQAIFSYFTKCNVGLLHGVHSAAVLYRGGIKKCHWIGLDISNKETNVTRTSPASTQTSTVEKMLEFETIFGLKVTPWLWFLKGKQHLN